MEVAYVFLALIHFYLGRGECARAQNVILQMGLRLLTPDGVRIEHAQSFAFRCDACFFITLQVRDWHLVCADEAEELQGFPHSPNLDAKQ